MKKILSLVLAMVILSSGGALAAIDNEMESALLIVKSKILIPEELSEFESSKEEYLGKFLYHFNWTSKNGEKNISVSSDAQGRIRNYHCYDNEWYNIESKKEIDVNFKIDDMISYADENIKAIMPEIFSNPEDCATLVPFSKTLNLNSRSSYSFDYVRKNKGIEVKDNLVSISILKLGDEFFVTGISSSWDFDTEFSYAEKTQINPLALENWTNKFPMKLQYRKTYDDKYILEYVTNGVYYLNNDTLNEQKEDDIYQKELYKYALTEDMAMSTSVGGGASNQTLTPKEKEELEKIGQTKTKDELLQILCSIEEFGMKNTYENIRMNIYPDDEDGYRAIINISDEEFSGSVTMDAVTGEIESFYRYDRINAQKEDENKEKAEDFLKKYFQDKFESSVANEEGNNATYTRLVNGIPYINNTISASWSEEKNAIISFYCEWDKDISKLPSLQGILSLDEAHKIMYEKYPLKLKYIIADKKYVLVNTQSNYDVKIDANSGKFINYSGEEIKEESKENYTDIDGHWVEKIAKLLLEYGIRTEGEKLRPDAEITQAEFLKLVYGGVCGSVAETDMEYIYRRMVNDDIISEEEKNSTEPISRELAIRYFLRAMGIREVAELEGIYVCDFKDKADISADKTGYCAIAKGFKIVSGADGYLYPKNNITCAEALVMIYNYLTR